MKMFFTRDEIQQLNEDEFVKLTTFGNDDKYYYSEVVSMNTSELSLTLRNGETLYTSSPEVFNTLSLGKSRFDMLTMTLSDVERDKNMKESFYREVTNNINSIIQNAVIDVKHAMTDITSTSLVTFSDLKNTNTNLRQIDVKMFESKMEKLDVIIKAFGNLLED